MDPKILFDEFDIDANDPELDEDMIADLCSMQFVKFRGVWYDLQDFITTSPGPWNHGLPEEFKDLPHEIIPEAMLRDETKPHITLEELCKRVGGYPPKYVRKKITTRYIKLPITGSEGTP